MLKPDPEDLGSMTEPFSVPFDGHQLRGDIRPGDNGDRVLILHGAGQSNLAKMTRLRDGLSAAGIGSAGFDFIGHGETGGDLASSSLSHRTDQVLAVLKHLEWVGPIGVVAASMSAYTAVRLMQHVNVANLVLLVPAMYTREAYAVPFASGFTELIRAKESWRRSDAWELLRSYRGRLLTVAGKDDAVIPPEVIQMIYANAPVAQERALLEIGGAGHFLFNDILAQGERHLETLMDLIAHTLVE